MHRTTRTFPIPRCCPTSPTCLLYTSIILNRGPHLIAEEAFGKSTEVNPCGFTVLVEDNEPEHIGYFSVY